MTQYVIYNSYGPSYFDFTTLQSDACVALCVYQRGTATFYGMGGWSSGSWHIGSIVYGPGTDCNLYSDGYYLTIGPIGTFQTPAIVHIVNGAVIDFPVMCPSCPATPTPTITVTPTQSRSHMPSQSATPSRTSSKTPSVTVSVSRTPTYTPSLSRCGAPDPFSIWKFYYSDASNAYFAGSIEGVMGVYSSFDPNTFHYFEGKTIVDSLVCGDYVWYECVHFPDGYYIVTDWPHAGGQPNYIFYIQGGIVKEWFKPYFIDQNVICWCCEPCETICGSLYINVNTGYQRMTWQPYNISIASMGINSTMDYYVAAGIPSSHTILYTGQVTSGPLDPGQSSVITQAWNYSDLNGFINLLYMKRVGEVTWNLVKSF